VRPSSAARLRQRHAFLAAAIATTLVLALGWLARQQGWPQAPVGAILALSIGAIVSALFAVLARRGGASLLRSAACGAALFVATVGPMVGSIHPGPVLAQAEFTREGEVRELGRALHGDLSVAVSADLPHEGSVAFSLGIGPSVLDGTLLRGTQRWRVGEKRGHYHEDRATVLLEAGAPAEVRALALRRFDGLQVPLRVTVYGRVLPAWFADVAAIVILSCLLRSALTLSSSRELVGTALVAVTASLYAAFTGSPQGAVAAVTRGVVLGTMVGVSGAALVEGGLRWVQHRLKPVRR
jgi:hypothetical protein